MPVSPVGSKRKVETLEGEAHWPSRNCPQPPCSPTPELRDAQNPEVVPSLKLTALSIWKNALRPEPRSSLPRNPMLELLLVTRLRRAKFCPDSAPAASTDSAAAVSVP